MYDKDLEKQSFSALAEDAFCFISCVAKEAKIHFDLSEESELEKTFDSFEKRLREKSRLMMTQNPLASLRAIVADVRNGKVQVLRPFI